MPKSSAKQRHAHMVGDPHRTPALLRAVSNTVKRGDIVLDIGTGLGILAIAAAKAGAKHVFAIETDKAALSMAKKNATKAGVLKNITFTRGLSFDVKLPERVDVILCETVGSSAFDENILATLWDAKKRFLKRGGKIVPAKLELWGAPIGRMPKVDKKNTGVVNKAGLLSNPTKLKTVNFASAIPISLHIKSSFPATKSGTAKAIALWPKAIWCDGSVSDASPLKPLTHWKQAIFPLEPTHAEKGKRLGFELIIGPHPEDPKRKTEMLWRWR